MTSQARDEGVSIKRMSTSKDLKEDRVLIVENALARQGWRECSGSLIIETRKRLHELKCWEIRTLQMYD